MNHKMNRRDFIKISGALSLALAAPLPLVSLARAKTEGELFKETRLRMGTVVTLSVAAASKDQATEAMAGAWSEMERLIDVFDRHRPGTAVSELNRHGRLSDPGPELLDVLTRAAAVHRLSDGAFDPTVLPLLTLIETRFERTGRAPESAELRQALELVDFGAVRFDRSGVRLGGEGRRISLDGIAKGYIVDRGGAALKKAGIENALINAGGDVLAMGRRPNGRPWRVAIQDPFKQDRYARVLDLTDRAVATSGSYEIHFDKKRAYHHLLSPETGRPASSMVSTTAVTREAAQADALSTAAFIRPEVLGRTPEADGLLINRLGRQKITPGLKRLIAG